MKVYTSESVRKIYAKRIGNKIRCGGLPLFNKKQVYNIRKEYCTTRISIVALARRHKTSVLTIRKILFGYEAYSKFRMKLQNV